MPFTNPDSQNPYKRKTTMKISAAFPSNYLKSDDLDGQPRIVTVRTCVQEELGQGRDKEKKPVLYFSKGTKGLVLNITNARVIAKAYGDDTGSWAGKPIEVYPTQVEFKGDLVDAIRVRIPDVPAVVAGDANTAPMSDAKIDEELNDEAPW